MLIHNRKYTTYYYPASQLETLCPNLPVETDGEALSSAFLSVFPNSTHLLCSLHKRDNITRKLREYKVDNGILKDILGDIFGSIIDDTYFEGLIDAKGSEEFVDKLKILKQTKDTVCW